MRPHSLLVASLAIVVAESTPAALILNPAQPITQQVRVHPIVVADDAGANNAPFLGTPAEQAAIEGFIDDIWAQAGIDVELLSPGTYHSTFALQGNPGNNNPRPGSDLNAILNAAAATGGVLHPDPDVLNLFFVQIVPFFSQQDDLVANGFGLIGSNGITQWVGPTLPTFNAGREAAAAVIAHEIGHNLGLPHIVEPENLMQEADAANVGERLSAVQIQRALDSRFSVPIPEPSAALLLLIGVITVLLARGR